MAAQVGLNRSSGIVIALLLFAVWTIATWYLEGRIETFLRPDAVTDRLIYAIVANLLIGIIGAVFVVRWLQRAGVTREDAGFGTPMRSAISVIVGAVLGLATYIVQGAPTLDPVVVLNAYSQVFVVSVAEVLVCWAVVGATVAASLNDRGRLIAGVVGAIVASVLFGLYHYAHTAPFNTFGMVAFLSIIGLVTSLFFFVSRDVYGTIVFHNFLGTFGVAQALKASGKLDSMATLQVPLIVTALVAIAVLVAADRFLLRNTSTPSPTAIGARR
jgi:hypothetical protein